MKRQNQIGTLAAITLLISMCCGGIATACDSGDCVGWNIDYPPSGDGVYVNVFSNIKVTVINCEGDCGGNGNGNGNGGNGGNGGGAAPGDLVFIGKKTGLMVANSQLPKGPMPGLASVYEADDCLKVGIFNIGDNSISIGRWELKVIEDDDCGVITGSRNTLKLGGTVTTHTIPEVVLPAIAGRRGGDGKPGFIEFSIPLEKSGSVNIILYDKDGNVVDNLRYTTGVMIRDNNGTWGDYSREIISMIGANQRWTTASWAA